MRYLIPHAIIAMAILALVGEHASETTCLVVCAIGHLAVPVWAAYVADAKTANRAVLLGPVLVIGIHVIGVLVAWLATIGGHPEDSWLTMMMVIAWTVAILVYSVYCWIVYSIVARVRGRR